MSRIFAVTIQEAVDARGFDGRPILAPGQFFVSAEAAEAILRAIGDDILIYRRDGGKLVHPDD